MKNLIFAAVVYCFMVSTIFAGEYEFTCYQPSSGVYEVNYKMALPVIKPLTINGITYSKIVFSAGVHTQQKGYAEIPFAPVSLMISESNDIDLDVTGEDYEDVPLNYPLLPSRGIIYRNQNPKEIPYVIDPNSVTHDWYPGDLANVSDPYIIRDVRGISVKVYPFQYNAGQKMLRVYRTIRIRLTEHNRTSTNPLTRRTVSILREMDGMYRSLFINYSNFRESLTIGPMGDLLVITTPRDTSAIAPYIRWKKEKGFRVSREVVATGTNVKSLILQKYNENPNLLYVQLVGDWAEIKSDLGTSSNYPMDPQLGCVAGTDPVADICIGRFSASDTSQVRIQVNKTIAYEKYPELSGSWYPRALGIASEEGPGDDNEIDYEHIGNIYNRKLDPFTYSAYDSIYEPNDYAYLVTTSVNQGVGIINYTGHGSSSSWVTTNFSNSHVNSLTNGSHLPFIISVACNNGQFHNTTCFAETWLRKSDGGAVMMLASTISQPWEPPMRGQDYINDLLTGGYDYSLYPGQNGITTTEQRITAGAVIFNSFALMYTESNGPDDLETMQTWTIFGDVTLMLRTAPPAEISLSNETIIEGIPFVTTVSASGPVEGAAVCLINGDSVYSGISDASGNVTIHHALTAGPVQIVVTGFNTTTYLKNDTVLNPEGPWMFAQLYSVSEDSGNGNGYADYGERVYLNIKAKNIGQDSSFGIRAVLRSADSLITILDSTFVYGDIPADSSVISASAFRIRISTKVPDQHRALCTVQFSDDSNSTWQSAVWITLSAPAFKILTMTIDDQSGGNGNGRLDPGDTARLDFRLINSGHATGFLTSGKVFADVPYLIFLSDSAWVDSIQSGDSVTMAFSLVVSDTVLKDVPAMISFHLRFNDYTAIRNFNITLGASPVYTMKNGTETVYEGKFYDSGGQTGNYKDNENSILTFLPSDMNKAVRAEFLSFYVETDWDYLYVHDGPDTSYPQIAGSPFTGTGITPVITATNPAGALTFRFFSDAYVNKSGWEALLSTIAVVNADDRSGMRPYRFELGQNYPNPFNPNTVIRYQLAVNSNVSLKIYNMFGQVVRTLTNKHETAGYHSVVWDGKNNDGRMVSSGVYIYRLETTSYVKTRKMILLK